MTRSGDGSAGALRARVEELAAENRWDRVGELLSDRDRARLLDDSTLAYRFGQALYYAGRIEELSEFAGRFEAATREAASPVAVMRALNLAGTAAFELGRVEEAQGRFDRLMELAEGEDDLEMQARAANNLGAVAALFGRVDESLSFYQLAAPLYQRLSRPRGLAEMHHNMAIAYRDLGRLDEATDAYREAAALARSVGQTPLAVLATVGRAEVELRRGDRALAGALIGRGLEQAREIGDPLSEADALRVRALLHGAAEERDAALADLREARSLAHAHGNRFLRAEVDRDRSRILADAGRVEAARAAGREALETFRSLGAALEAERMRARLEGLEAEAG